MNNFKLPKFGTKQVKKATKTASKTAQKVAKAAPKAGTVKKQVKQAVRPAAKKAGTVVRKAASSVVRPSAGGRSGGVGYRKYDGDALWLPNTERPEWLDGSMTGDRGFDPLGLSKPVEYLQVDLDNLDQNKPRNAAGAVIGEFTQALDEVSEERLQPYKEVFGLQRFRECELIHGRWAMLACLGCIVGEGATGVSWVEAGKVELDGAQYFGQSLPFSISQLCWIEALAVGGAEVYRNTQLDPVQRCYPGGFFDPLELASDDSDKTARLRESEIKHSRLAMIAFLGYSVQALATGQGALGSLAVFAKQLNN